MAKTITTSKAGSKLKATIKGVSKTVTINPALVKLGSIPAILNSKDHKLQYKGSYMKADTVNGDQMRRQYGTTNYPLSWFELFIGQLIYAISETDFVGVIEIANKQQAKKLEALQGNGYTFLPLHRIGEKLEEANEMEEEEVETDDDKLYAAYEKALDAIHNYRSTIGIDDDYIAKGFYVGLMAQGAVPDGHVNNLHRWEAATIDLLGVLNRVADGDPTLKICKKHELVDFVQEMFYMIRGFQEEKCLTLLKVMEIKNRYNVDKLTVEEANKIAHSYDKKTMGKMAQREGFSVVVDTEKQPVK